jgi:prepilin-type N-terminal cleavage/methylation domain-containing protein
MKKKLSIKGFTLSELLISLSVLGLISALTLPAIFNSVDEQKKKAVFKETLTALAEASAEESNTDARSMGSIKFIESNMNSQSCSTNMSITNPTDPRDVFGCILQNGAYVYHLDKVSDTNDNLVIDWNGNAPPNIHGQDRLIVWINWGAEPVTSTVDGNISTSLMGNPTSLNPGQILPRIEDATMFTDLYK